MNRSYFTIAEIMLVIAVAAIFFSAGRVTMQEHGFSAEIRPLIMLRILSGVIIGATIGISIGASRRRWKWGVFFGSFFGAASGCLAATILSLPQNVPLALIGAAILLLGGLLIRLLSRGTF